MVTYKSTSVTAKGGINFLRATVEESGDIFHKIEQENDLGIGGLIEFVRDGEPLGKVIGTQVKSGDSYYNRKTAECLIPVENHREYWLKYQVPVIGITYIPSLKTAH